MMMLRIICLLICYRGVTSELGHSFGANANGENETWKDLDLSHRHHDPKYLLGRYAVGELPTDSADCRRPAKCINMQHATCMGTRLPYGTTTMDLIPGHTTQDMIQEKLRLLQGARHIPKCWAVVQPFLCSLFMPKCTNDTVDLPSQEMCKMVTGPCRILFNQTIWPNFIRCDDRKLFPRFCKNDVRELKFNTTGKCLRPLIPSDNNLAIFEGIEGCGVQCSDPLFTFDEQEQIHTIIAWGAGLSGTINFLTVVTFLIGKDWRSANKYPAQGIFYINFCFMVSCFGWLVQFMVGREVIVCRKDGTPRINEPSGETLSCVAVFFLLYYSLMAAMIWFVIFAYAWHMSFQGLGKIQDRIDKKKAYFHMIAWCLPIVLTVAVITLGEIDGNSVTGICFVGYTNHYARAWFLHGPLLVVLAFGGYFLGRGLITLIYLKISSQEIISKRASKKIRDNIVRMILFSILTIISAVVTIWCYVYEFQNSSEWRRSFRNYMICSITTKYAEESECKMDSRPSIAVFQIQVLAPFCTSVLMSSWVWRRSTVETWKRFFKKTFKCEDEEPVKQKKHKVIAQAFAKRKNFNNEGRLSISFRKTHDDPVGVNFNLDSVDSQDISSSWAAALPKLVVRRDAVVGGNTSSVSSIRRNSGDSEISYSMRRVSVESRRNSIDSQISVQYAEVKARRKVPGSRSRRSKRRRDSSKISSKISKVGPVLRRGSTTSQESQLGAQILSTLTSAVLPATGAQMPNMKRRSAIAGLDERLLAKITNEKSANVLLPFLFAGASGSDDDDDDDDDDEENENAEMNDRGGKLKRDARNGLKLAAKDERIESNERMSDSEEASQAEQDETRIMMATDETTRERASVGEKAATRTKHARENVRRSRERIKSKYFIAGKTTMTNNDGKVYKNLFDHENVINVNDEAITNEDTYGKACLVDLASSLTELCPELCRIMRTDLEKGAREIATQTSLPLDILEMEELRQSIDEIINSRNCGSKTTRISPKLSKTNCRRNDDTYR